MFLPREVFPRFTQRTSQLQWHPRKWWILIYESTGHWFLSSENLGNTSVPKFGTDIFPRIQEKVPNTRLLSRYTDQTRTEHGPILKDNDAKEKFETNIRPSLASKKYLSRNYAAMPCDMTQSSCKVVVIWFSIFLFGNVVIHRIVSSGVSIDLKNTRWTYQAKHQRCKRGLRSPRHNHKLCFGFQRPPEL